MRADDDDPHGRLKALESERLAGGGPRFLFTGAARLTSPLHELASEDEDLARSAHAVCRRCKDVVCHVFEFAHDPLEALSFLACQGWPTPLLDFSTSADAAVADAHGGVTAVDLDALPDYLVSCDSSFLAHCRGLEGPPLRWLERGGITLTHSEWRSFDTAADFELLSPPLAQACRRFALDDADERPAVRAPAPADEELRERLRASIRTAGRKILGSAGVGAIDELIARVLPG